MGQEKLTLKFVSAVHNWAEMFWRKVWWVQPMKLFCAICGICVHGSEIACLVLNSPGFQPVPCADSKKGRTEPCAAYSFPKNLLRRGSHLWRERKAVTHPQRMTGHSLSSLQSCPLQEPSTLHVWAMSSASVRTCFCDHLPMCLRDSAGSYPMLLQSVIMGKCHWKEMKTQISPGRVYSGATQDWPWSGSIALDFCKYWVPTW